MYATEHICLVASSLTSSKHGSVGAWAKRYYFASRTALEAVLRPYDLGTTQWYALYQLAVEGPTMQRAMQRILQVERATLSGIVATLVAKGLVEQVADRRDQRQKLLRLTELGTARWCELPDPIVALQSIAFAGVDDADLARAAALLETATRRLQDYGKED